MSCGDLIQAVLAEPDLPRLRLSSLEPWDLELDFFELWQDARLCRHLHLPLQSGCAATLRRMARKTTPQAYADLVRAARAAIPGVAITTDIIVGFPGESEAEFAASLEFIQRDGICRRACLHLLRPPRHRCCPHARSGAPSAAQSSAAGSCISLFAQAEQRYQAQFIGQRLPVAVGKRAAMTATAPGS